MVDDLLNRIKCAGVYEIRCAADGRRYIGSSSNPLYRLGQHLMSLRVGNNPNPPMQEAFNLHGEDSFSFHMVAWTSPEYAPQLERGLIKRIGQAELFNVWGEGIKASELTRARMSSSQRARYKDPAERERTSRDMVRALSDPSIRKQMSERATRGWATRRQG